MLGKVKYQNFTGIILPQKIFFYGDAMLKIFL
jgi:hypothetical protein